MTDALIISFQYSKELLLKSARCDMQAMTTWCAQWGCNIYTYTDYDSADDGKHIITNLDSLLSKLPICSSRILVYYSGHGMGDNILWPDGTTSDFRVLRDAIVSRTIAEAEIFWIMDCCNPSHLALPFVLQNNTFHMRNPDSEEVEYIRCKLVLITSSEHYQKSLASHTGSLFTENLLTVVQRLRTDFERVTAPVPVEFNRNLSRLCFNITNGINSHGTPIHQRVNVYSSYIIDPVLWLWIGSGYNLSVDMSGVLLQ